MKTEYSNYCQKVIKEINNGLIYIRIIQLENQTEKIFLVECLYKFIHEYRKVKCKNYRDAKTLLNKIID